MDLTPLSRSGSIERKVSGYLELKSPFEGQRRLAGGPETKECRSQRSSNSETECSFQADSKSSLRSFEEFIFEAEKSKHSGGPGPVDPGLDRFFLKQMTNVKFHWRGTKVNCPSVFSKVVLAGDGAEFVQDFSGKLLYPNQIFRGFD